MRNDLAIVRWLVFGPEDDDAIAALSFHLDDAERARAERFHFQRDRSAYIAAHALTRITLSSIFTRRPSDWRFQTSCHGKPSIDHADESRQLSFNLSHAHGIVAVAVTREHDIGVDVERVEPGRLSIELAQHYFAPTEMALVRATAGEDPTDTLFAFWTLKEAYIKAVGLGLAIPLDAFAFTLEPLAISFDARLADDAALWRLHRMRPTTDHALALALRHPTPLAVDLDIRERKISDLAYIHRDQAPGSI